MEETIAKTTQTKIVRKINNLMETNASMDRIIASMNRSITEGHQHQNSNINKSRNALRSRC